MSDADAPELRFEYCDVEGVISDRRVTNFHADETHFSGFDLERRAIRTFRRDRVLAWRDGTDRLLAFAPHLDLGSHGTADRPADASPIAAPIRSSGGKITRAARFSLAQLLLASAVCAALGVAADSLIHLPPPAIVSSADSPNSTVSAPAPTADPAAGGCNQAVANKILTSGLVDLDGVHDFSIDPQRGLIVVVDAPVWRQQSVGVQQGLLGLLNCAIAGPGKGFVEAHVREDHDGPDMLTANGAELLDWEADAMRKADAIASNPALDPAPANAPEPAAESAAGAGAAQNAAP